MLKKLGILVLLVVLVIVGLALTDADSFRVARSTQIKAAPEKVFGSINDFKRWPEWSPWEKMDPAMKRTLSGADSGKGATYEWEGNDNVGKGRMEIVDSVPGKKVTIRLDFFKPFEAHNTAEFTMEGKGDATALTWAMTGPNPFIAKVMHVFVSIDKLVGKDFETGLANLKALSEK